MNTLEEKLKDIPGYEGLYSITEDAQIWSNRNKKFLKQWTTDNGYKQVVIAGKAWRPHRLVAMTYIPNPENKPFVNHLNGVRDDNRTSNLEWCTQSENARHSIDVLGNWVNNRGINSPNASLTDAQVLEMRKLKREGFSYSRLSRIFNTSQPNVVAITKGLTWKHLPVGITEDE